MKMTASMPSNPERGRVKMARIEAIRSRIRTVGIQVLLLDFAIFPLFTP